MAKIIENLSGRRNIQLNIYEVLDIVREYQVISQNCNSFEELKTKVNQIQFLLPEDI